VNGNERRKLDYIIVRAVGLGNNPGTGTVSAGKVQLAKVVKQEHPVRVAVQCIEEPGSIGLIFDVTAGDIPIPEEIFKVTSERIDVFGGFY
jgi:hypothetical protein